MPTSNGLSYSMNSFPRIACTIGAFSLPRELDQLRVRAGAARSAEDRDLRCAPFSILRQRRDLVIGRAHDRLRLGKMQARPSCSTASRKATSPGRAMTATPRRESAVCIAISSTRGICSGWDTSSQ